MKIINKLTKFYLLMDIKSSNGVRCLGMCVADNDY